MSKRITLNYMDSKITMPVALTAFLLICAALLTRIGSLQSYFDYCVPHSITQAVNLALDGHKYPIDMTWYWTDMNQDDAGRSPIFTATVYIGIKLFGFTLFGTRIVGVILSFLTLILIFYTINKFFSRLFSLLFLALLVSSPMYLTIARSGSIMGLSLSMVAVSLCLTALLFRSRKGVLSDKWMHDWILPVLAGVSTAILPYGYTITRIIPIVLVLWVWINVRRLGARRVAVFTASVFAVVSVQIPNLRDSMKLYFNARGESIITSIGGREPGTSALSYILSRLLRNTQFIINYFLGLNKPEQFLNVPIADSFWSPNNVFYPKFLVPFLIAGIIWAVYHWVTKKRFKYIAPVLFLGITVLPGLLCGTGNPEQSRLSIMVLPAYFLMAYAFYRLFLLCFIWFGKGMRGVCASLVGLIFVFTLVYQIHNFFTIDRSPTPEGEIAVQKCLQDLWNKDGGATMVFQEYAILSEFSYVSFRWMGGAEMEQRINDGSVMLVRYENMDEIKQKLQDKQIYAFVTQQDDFTKDRFPELNAYARSEAPNYVLYTRQ